MKGARNISVRTLRWNSLSSCTWQSPTALGTGAVNDHGRILSFTHSSQLGCCQEEQHEAAHIVAALGVRVCAVISSPSSTSGGVNHIPDR